MTFLSAIKLKDLIDEHKEYLESVVKKHLADKKPYQADIVQDSLNNLNNLILIKKVDI